MVGTSVKLEAVYVLAFSMVQQHKKQLKIIARSMKIYNRFHILFVRQINGKKEMIIHIK